jgi:hypothetical protein
MRIEVLGKTTFCYRTKKCFCVVAQLIYCLFASR